MTAIRCLGALLCSAVLVLGEDMGLSRSAHTLRPYAATCNTASNRQCWTPIFNISTDYETSWPTTGVTRKYTLTITEVDNWVGGDGVRKEKAMLVNGQYPGPTLTADWGDRMEITVNNNLRFNGTSIHWHGIRQLNSCTQDGVGGITECPIPPRGSKTYSFLATQYGTAWYHSHFSVQSANGVAGPIVINGPTSGNYDTDLGPLMVSDWYYEPADQILARISKPEVASKAKIPGGPPTSDNVLFNGKNVSPRGGGSYHRVTLTPGKTHLLRIINPSVENTFQLSLVGHKMTVIATDLVPVTPAEVDSIYIGVAQRYDVLITANQAVGNYWFNASMPSGPCGASSNGRPAAIFSYTGSSQAYPSNKGTVPGDAMCDEPRTSFKPVVKKTVDVAGYVPRAGNTLNADIVLEHHGVAKVFWPVNNSPMNVSWNDPTLEYVRDGRVAQMPKDENVIAIPQKNMTTFWLIQNNSSVPHPIHLHGHDIMEIGASPPIADPLAAGQKLRPYNAATDQATLNGNNPTRRDTTMLPAWGWLLVAFVTNNPGAWLFHCHTTWHVAQGFSIQFLEQVDAIPKVMNLGELRPSCALWDAYYPARDPYHKEDSGI